MESNQVSNLLYNFRPDLFFPQTFLERLQFYATPGVSLALVNNFALEWVGQVGVADSNGALTSETLFQAASISKPVTAVAVLKLVELGQLSLDADVRDYLTSWRVPWDAKVTLRHLLSHTAGLNVHGFEGYKNGSLLPSVLQILNGESPANSDALRLEELPESKMVYSGGGFTLLQMILEDVLKKPFAQIMSELLLEPLSMTRSSFLYPRDELVASGHPEHGLPLEGQFHLYPEMAAAGLWTTASDLARFGLALLQNKYLGQATFEMMLSPQLPEPADSLSFMGLGFGCDRKPSGVVFKHNGWNEGFVAQMRFCRETGQGAVVMLNSNSGFAMLEEIMAVIAREYNWSF